MPETASNRRKPVDHVLELRELVIGYARQETIEPLAELRRYLQWGVAGGLAVGLGCFLLLLSLLRGLQAIDGIEHSTGWLSLIPYVATLLVGALMIVAAGMAITKGGRKGTGR